ncbi:sulfotransferase [Pseudoxanthomonas sp.]|uniref:sulfotransferase n=1 Tax=Pseudoxanthomonas sp. TaxID=1871049 RepID=UPI002E0F2CC0|nr:sulfotransferase [Pseudoxanthomonas sp.]
MTAPVPMLHDAAFMPFRLDAVGRRMLFVRLDRTQRARAAFLDERALADKPQGGWVPLDALPPLTGAPPGCHFLFHIGHCGSTLLSRLLAEHPQTQVLREPLTLRGLAEHQRDAGLPEGRFSRDEWQALLHDTVGRLARPLAPDRHCIIKATSSCNSLVSPLLAAFPGARAIFMDMPLRPYLATVLKSPDSVRDALTTAPARLAWLRERVGDDAALQLHRLTLSQQCAMVWLAEHARRKALQAGPEGDRVLHVDFERLLETPESTLEAIAGHLGWDAAWIGAAKTSSAWARYSKAPQHGYSVEDRRHDLERSLGLHREAIVDAEAFVSTLQQRHPSLA